MLVSTQLLILLTTSITFLQGHQKKIWREISKCSLARLASWHYSEMQSCN